MDDLTCLYTRLASLAYKHGKRSKLSHEVSFGSRFPRFRVGETGESDRVVIDLVNDLKHAVVLSTRTSSAGLLWSLQTLLASISSNIGISEEFAIDLAKALQPGAAPDFQRAHCLCNLSGNGVSFVVVDFTVRVFPDLTINHWLSLFGHAVPQASSSVCKKSQSP